jgi:hypothetical protein
MANSADFGDETLLDSVRVRKFFGGRSEQWIPRRERDRDEGRGGVPFPLPIIIAGRRYWLLGELRAYRDACPRFGTVRPNARLPPRPPKGRRWNKGDRVAKASTGNSKKPRLGRKPKAAASRHR